MTLADIIREEFNKIEKVTIGSWNAITVEYNGVKQNFLVNQKRVQTPANQAKGIKAVLHLLHIKRGKFLSSDAQQYNIANHYKLDGKDNFDVYGMPTIATDCQLMKWKNSGFAF
jgi:hypothetical protein